MKKGILVISCILISVICFSQEEETTGKGFQKEKLFIGGNFGLSFGDLTLLNISPQVGYRFTDLFAAGLGLNGQYVSVKNRYIDGTPYSKTSQGVFGLNLFGRLYPINNLMIQLQPEANYIFGKQTFYGSTNQEYKMDAVIVPSLLVGAGIVLPSGRGSFIASYFYDVLQKPNAPYGSRPFLNIGYNLSLQ